jgi:hypothetical protein
MGSLAGLANVVSEGPIADATAWRIPPGGSLPGRDKLFHYQIVAQLIPKLGMNWPGIHGIHRYLPGLG